MLLLKISNQLLAHGPSVIMNCTLRCVQQNLFHNLLVGFTVLLVRHVSSDLLWNRVQAHRGLVSGEMEGSFGSLYAWPFEGPVVTAYTTRFNIQRSYILPTDCMQFLCISEQTTLISPYNFNWLVFVFETEYVYCAVRIGSLNIFRGKLSPREFCGGQGGSGAGFSPPSRPTSVLAANLQSRYSVHSDNCVLRFDIDQRFGLVGLGRRKLEVIQIRRER